MRPASLILILALSACAAHRPAAPGSGPIADGGTVTVKLSNFAYDPENLRLRAGVPVTLRLVNESDGGHDFKAPGFFAASTCAMATLGIVTMKAVTTCPAASFAFIRLMPPRSAVIGPALAGFGRDYGTRVSGAPMAR